MLRRTQLRPLVATLAVAGWLLSAGPARADLFSPGELSRPHATLEGLKNCTKCHAAGQQLSPDTCLTCHKELKPRVDAGKGLHGRIPPAERACETCHHEHQGREFELVEWVGGKKAFDHGRAGFPLQGAHKKLDCAKCHETRRIADDTVRKLLLEQPKRETFLGLGTKCTDCHFDEHRGQLKNDCQKCHTEAEWKPPRGFDHAKTAYALEGKHQKVACLKCHVNQEDTTTAAEAFPGPKSRTFSKFSDVAHGKCTDCHQDPHDNRFGQRCDTCHTPQDWKIVRGQGAERAFHERTAFPLRGAHAEVACANCHGTPMKMKGLRFERCADCHVDAHQGQVDAGLDCNKCHTIDAFRPSTFDATRHAQTDFPLAGKHVKTACTECHVEDRNRVNKVTATVRKQLQKAKRKELFSLLTLTLPTKDGCQGCHADAHQGQLGSNSACDRCHSADGFAPARYELEDHAKSRYPLAGAHQAVACQLCHVADPKLEARVPPAVQAAAKRTGHATFSLAVLHPPGADQGCVACHKDPHGGQFDARIKAGGCQSCHDTTSFTQVRFNHDTESRFPLTGRHATATCSSCHVPERTDGKAGIVRYRPQEMACAGCHEDVHVGQFAPRPGAPTDCTRCHVTTDFHDVTAFRHAPPFTPFELTGKHAAVACKTCHTEVTLASRVTTRRYKPLPQACESCHQDQHGGAFKGFEP